MQSLLLFTDPKGEDFRFILVNSWLYQEMEADVAQSRHKSAATATEWDEDNDGTLART
jgi:hypothetical protein